MLGGVTEVLELNFQIAGTLFNNISIIAANLSREAGFGLIDLIQMNSEKGVILCKTFSVGAGSLSMVLVIEKNANITLAKHHLEKVCAEIQRNQSLTID